MSNFESRRFRFSIAVGVGLTLLCCLFDQIGLLSALDNWFSDVRAAQCQVFSEKPDDRIVHVDIDDAALDPGAVGRWPWPRKTFARIIDEIGNAKPKAIGIDVRFSEPQNVEDEIASGSGTPHESNDDALLEQALARQKNVVLVGSFRVPTTELPSAEETASLDLMHRNPELDEEDFIKAMRSKGFQIQAKDDANDLYIRSRKIAIRDAVGHKLKQADLTDEQLARSILPGVDPSIDSPSLRTLQGEASDCRSRKVFERFGFDAVRLPVQLVPEDFDWFPLQKFSQSATAGGFANFEFFPSSTVRAMPLLVEADHRLYAQFGLAFGCTILGADIRNARIGDNEIVVPRTGGRAVRIPTRSYYSTVMRRSFAATVDIPWFGTSNWQTMYDWPSHRRAANHLPVNLIWDTCKTIDKIEANNQNFDTAIQNVFRKDELDTKLADAYAASLPPIDDTSSRERVSKKVLGNVKSFLDQFEAIPTAERTPGETDELSRLHAGFKALQVGNNNEGFYKQLSNTRADLSARLAGKGVLLGWTAENVEGVDNEPTSLHTRCPGVVIHGVIAEAVLSGHWPHYAPGWLGICLILLLGLVTTFAVAHLQPLNAAVAALFLLIAYLIVNGYVLFDFANWVVPVAGSVVTISAVWSGCTLQRVILEGIERNRVATEVAIISREMELAHQVQAALIPKHAPTFAGLEADGWTQPADTTGGDCYDLWKLPDGRLAILVADASGHGLAPAMIVSQVRTLVRALSEVDSSPLELMKRVNTRVADDIQPGRFVTVFLGFLSTDGYLDYASAAHGPQFWYGPDGTELHLLDSTGAPLGIDVEWLCDDPLPPIQLPIGGSLIVFSDGIFEAMTPTNDQFGLERLEAILKSTRGQPGKIILDQIITAVTVWQHKRPPADDQTVVIARRVAM